MSEEMNQLEVKNFEVGDLVKGKVTKVEEKQVIVEMAESKLDGIIPISELSSLHVEKASDAVSEGDELELEVLKIEEEALILSKRKVDAKKAWVELKEKAENLSSVSRGRPGIGIELLADKNLLKKYELEAMSLFDIIKKGTLKDKFNYLDNLVKPKMNFLETRESFQKLLSIWALALRDCLLAKTSNYDFLVNGFMKQELNDLAKNYSLPEIKELLRKIIQTKKYLYYNINSRLAVENLILNF